MNKLQWLFAVITLGVSINSYAAENDKSIDLVSFLNNFTVIGDSSSLSSVPLSARVIAIRDSKVCYTESKGCENQMLYIAVSEYDEEPEQAVYSSVFARAWEFEDIKFNEKDGCLDIRLKKVTIKNTTLLNYCINTEKAVISNADLKKL